MGHNQPKTTCSCTPRGLGTTSEKNHLGTLFDPYATLAGPILANHTPASAQCTTPWCQWGIEGQCGKYFLGIPIHHHLSPQGCPKQYMTVKHNCQTQQKKVILEKILKQVSKSRYTSLSTLTLGHVDSLCKKLSPPGPAEDEVDTYTALGLASRVSELSIEQKKRICAWHSAFCMMSYIKRR